MTDEDTGIESWGKAADDDAWSDVGDSRTLGKATTTQQTETTADQRPDYIEPPYDPEQLALLLERSGTHAACCQAKARGVAGYGFELVPHERAESDEPPGFDTLDEFWREGTFQLGPDAQPASAEEVLETAWNDYESIGYLAIEILANPATGEPTGLAHVPAHTIRKREGKPGWVQLDEHEQAEVYFGTAGDRYETGGPNSDQTFVDSETGEFGTSVGDVDTVANELLVIRNYSALAPHYGTPDIIPELQTLFADLEARRYNASFFENDTVPRLAAVVEGGQLTEAARDQLEQNFREMKGADDAHRLLTLEAVKGADTTGLQSDPSDVSLRLEPLTVGQEEDASFIEFRKENETDIRQVHEVPKVVLGRTEGVNYASAQSQRRQYANTTIQPRQERLAGRVYSVLHKTAFDIDGWTIEFTLRGGESAERQANIHKTRITAGETGGMTVDEARAIQGLEPLGPPEGEMLLSEINNATGRVREIESMLERAREEGASEQEAADKGYSITERAGADD